VFSAVTRSYGGLEFANYVCLLWMVKFARNDELVGDQYGGSYVIDVDNNAGLISSVMKIRAWASGGVMN
jgi:hypothetical protein